MRKFLLAALFLLAPLQAIAAEHPKSERKQETIELGNNRFLIFVGEPNNSQFAYTADLVVTQNGVPHFEPLFTEEYDPDTNSVNLSEGIAFQAETYHFDKNTYTLDFTMMDTNKHVRYQYKYLLAVDMFTLQQVVMQKGEGSLPKTLYRAGK